MYERFMNSQVSVYVTPKSDNFLDYKGTLVEENENSIVLNNVVIELATTTASKKMAFVQGAYLLKSNVSTVVINKEFIMSCISL